MATDHRERANHPNEAKHDAMEPAGAAVADPSALVRLGTTLRALRDEVRELELDDQAMQRLTTAHATLLDAICDTLAPELQDELSRLNVELDGEPTQATVRLVQSQLLGWIEGLFVGLQATLAGRGAAQGAAGRSAMSPEPAGAARQDPRYL
ncbi:MAG: proteasome activator [Acidimicrobiia bacterium]